MKTPPSFTRRDLLRSAAALGLTVPVLGGCATGGGSGKTPKAAHGAVSKQNPLGVPAGSPLEVVIFKGGYGDAYAKSAEAVYAKRYPHAKITHQGIQAVGDALRPRFVANTPPDVVDNSGDGRLDIATLVAAKEVTDLAPLLDAPSWDTPGRTVRQTLLPGVVDDGSFDGTCLRLNYTYVAYGIWYSKPLFTRKGWTYPTTWDEMLALCEEIKTSGIAPWTYQGKYPEYMSDPLLTMAAKIGGEELMKSVDNLEPNAWRADAMKNAAADFAELAAKGYIMSGSEALSHTEAQAAWCQGKAAFIPCGSWLESEQQGVTPAGFDMVVGPIPSHSASDKLGPKSLEASSSESFIVPARAGNVAGGLEYLRILFSVEQSKAFAKSAGTMPAVAGATDGLTMSSALASASAAVAAAGQERIDYKSRGWYDDLTTATDTATGELINKRISPDQWCDRIQKAADAVARDSSVKKYRRT